MAPKSFKRLEVNSAAITRGRGVLVIEVAHSAKPIPFQEFRVSGGLGLNLMQLLADVVDGLRPSLQKRIGKTGLK